MEAHPNCDVLFFYGTELLNPTNLFSVIARHHHKAFGLNILYGKDDILNSSYFSL